MRTTRFVTLLVFALVFAYAIIRYVLLGTVSPSQLPVFIVNKALAVASIALIAIALAIGPLVRMRAVQAAWMQHRKQLGVNGFVAGALHSVLTVAMLSPVSYSKLYDGAGRLTFNGGLVVLGGVLTFAALTIPAITSASLVRKSMPVESWRRAQQLGLVALVIALAHVAVLGWKSWLAPQTWPGGLPPLTIIAIAFGALSFAIRAASIAHRAAQRAPEVPPYLTVPSRP